VITLKVVYDHSGCKKPFAKGGAAARNLLVDVLLAAEADRRARPSPRGERLRRQGATRRKQDVDERKEQEAILETYLQALGMLA